MSKNTQAKLDAVSRYNAEKYKRYMIALRVEDDADIIADWEEAKEHGYSGREWIRELFEAK